ncbi:MAG: 2Fe-2S iron-sulfur cluster binding domain-containing protein [Spirochaetales bacterium]|nr:2Fe-2S iron-sulfur cluster binding domain-containing protein [Spirochaetales bacterium]
MDFATFIPVLMINGILITITILLIIAEKMLISYGKCKIKVKHGGETREFTVEGGTNLLSNLTSNGVAINSSCGGKGSCGYCKVRVLEGGGQILPTEEIFMSRKEIKNQMRLACQVKIKEDITIEIPDYLTVIRQMVINKKFNTKKRWKVNIK